jgi:tRNA 2-(methylsulfanyl)-N6-isopentenyladenosine37 hydroxylase
VQRVAEQPLALLVDHAHCELGAAASAQALIAKNPRRAELVRDLAETARTELEHFELVVRILHARGGELEHGTPSPYAGGLHRAAARTGHGTRGHSPLLDRLLIAGLIEARSLERFHLLSTHLEDAELSALYRGLMASEAAHRAMFHRLAVRYHDFERVAQRLEELALLEAEVITALPHGPRMHSGPC